VFAIRQFEIMPKLLLYILLFIAAGQSLFAQDKHFTQFYAAPLALNPALTGAFEGRYRVSTIYRDQWRRVLESPIRTFAVAADFRFDAPFKAAKKDAFAAGLYFYNDQVSIIDFNTTQIAVSLAYHKALDAAERQFLTLGIQGGLTQRSVNYGALNFPDEFDGFSGYNVPTGEELPENSLAFTDWNVGLNYSARFGRASAVYLGGALHHFARPEISFFANGNDGDRLHMKMSAQLSANLPIGASRRLALLPRLLVARQGPHMEINAGTNFRFALGEYGGSAMHVGGWVRPVRSINGFNVDAAVALLGFEINNVLFGLSYDLNLPALQAGQRQAAFEISVAYLGNYESEDILCPKF
jgi:type IX secretion system PorP/SprF family membrane protein